ncbi:GPKOW protein, partial [Menura novaehollandiae]|nr:GPKOW protein [Menura novaehollandiae]
IEDLLSSDTCVCRMDGGCLVEGLRKASLEMVVPWGDSDRVVVVLGEHVGKLGQILQQEPERGWALVQLGQDAAPQVLLLPYNFICHYLGAGED